MDSSDRLYLSATGSDLLGMSDRQREEDAVLPISQPPAAPVAEQIDYELDDLPPPPPPPSVPYPDRTVDPTEPGTQHLINVLTSYFDGKDDDKASKVEAATGPSALLPPPPPQPPRHVTIVAEGGATTQSATTPISAGLGGSRSLSSARRRKRTEGGGVATVVQSPAAALGGGGGESSIRGGGGRGGSNKAADDVFHDMTATTSGSERDSSPVQPIPRPTAPPTSTRSATTSSYSAVTIAASRRWPPTSVAALFSNSHKRKKAVSKEPWRLSAAPVRYSLNDLWTRSDADDDEEEEDEEGEEKGGERRDVEEVWEQFISRQGRMENRRQLNLAQSRAEAKEELKRMSQPGLWLRTHRRSKFLTLDLSSTNQLDFLERVRRRQVARKAIEVKRRQDRDVELFGPCGPNVRCMNRRSKELLERRQKLAKGKAKLFERLYQSSKSYKAEKIVSSILLDKGALSDGPRKLSRRRQRRASLRARRASDGDNASVVSAASDWSACSEDEGATVDGGMMMMMGGGFSLEEQTKLFSRALKERLRARIQVAKTRLDNRDVGREQENETGWAASSRDRNTCFRRKSRKLFRQRVQNEVAAVLQEQGQGDSKSLTHDQALHILQRFHILPPNRITNHDNQDGHHAGDGDGDDEDGNRRKAAAAAKAKAEQHRLVNHVWEFLRIVTKFQLGTTTAAAAAGGDGPSSPSRATTPTHGGGASTVTLESVVMLILRVATQGMQTVKNSAGQYYGLQGSDVDLMARLRHSHLMLRLANKAQPTASKVYRGPASGAGGEEQQQTGEEGGSSSKPMMCKRSVQIVEGLKKKNAEKLSQMGIQAPGVYHTWLAESNVQVIQRALLGGGGGGGSGSPKHNLAGDGNGGKPALTVSVDEILARSSEVQGPKRESKRIKKLEEEMKECTFSPQLNKMTLQVMKRRGRPTTHTARWDQTLSPRIRCRSTRHYSLYQDGKAKIKERRDAELRRSDPEVMYLRAMLEEVKREKEEEEGEQGGEEETKELQQIAAEKRQEKKEETMRAKREEEERREREVRELVQELKDQGLFTPRLPTYDPAAILAQTRSKSFSASTTVRHYQEEVDRLHRGLVNRRSRLAFHEKLRIYSDDEDYEAGGGRGGRERKKPDSPRKKAPTVPEPFNLSPRNSNREFLRCHRLAHEKEQNRIKEEEEKRMRARRLAREIAEASVTRRSPSPAERRRHHHHQPTTTGTSPAAGGGGALYDNPRRQQQQQQGGSQRRHPADEDPLLYVDVVLSGDDNKIRVPVLRGDSPKQVARDFGERHNLSADAVRLLEVTFRTHMSQTLWQLRQDVNGKKSYST